MIKTSDRETAHVIIHMTDGLLSHGGHVLPTGLAAALREYKSALLAECSGKKWAWPGHPTRYGFIADLIGQQISDGKWNPGERMPSICHLAAMYDAKTATIEASMHVLATRGRLAFESGSYYVLPDEMTLY